MGLLDGRVAVVTGSGRGIGREFARCMASEGAKVVVNDVGVSLDGRGTEEDPAATVCREIEEGGGEAVPNYDSVTDFAGAERIVNTAVESFGRVDILVNNAGIQFVAPIDEFPEAKWDAILAINLSSAFHATKAVLPGMKQRKWGRIINVASAHGLVASAFKSAYVAAKHGVVGLTKVTAMETAEDGITCNAICPGYVWTPLVQKQIPEQAKAHGMSEEEVVRKVLLANQPNKRFATVEEMGALAVFLCSQGAASMTGTALPVDGGWTAH